MKNELRQYWFRIDSHQDGCKWNYVFINENIKECKSEREAFYDLNSNMVCEAKPKTSSPNSQAEQLYSYVFYNRYKDPIPFFSNKGWALRQIHEEDIEQEGDSVLFYLTITDPKNKEQKVKCYIYKSVWKPYGNRCIFIMAAAIDYWLWLSNNYESWQDPEADKMSNDRLICYKHYQALSMKHHEDLIRALKKG